MGKKLYVGNLSYGVSQDELSDYFSQYGAIAEAKLITDHDGRSKGFAFIEFEAEESAAEALKADGEELQGRKMKVNEAREGGGRRGGGGGGRGGFGGGRGGNGGRGGYGGGNRGGHGDRGGNHW